MLTLMLEKDHLEERMTSNILKMYLVLKSDKANYWIQRKVISIQKNCKRTKSWKIILKMINQQLKEMNNQVTYHLKNMDMDSG